MTVKFAMASRICQKVAGSGQKSALQMNTCMENAMDYGYE